MVKKIFFFIQIADIGDVRANMYNTPAACEEITKQYRSHMQKN
jgi:hypothetical protein